MEHLQSLATDVEHSVINDSAHAPKAYTAYGLSADQGRTISAFCGEPKDPLTGCYHLGNGYRQFDPGIMRFQNADAMSPFGKGGINAYMYCAGDPVNRRDPSGAYPLPRSLRTTLATTTTPSPVPPIVSEVARHALNGGVGALNVAGVALSLALPVPASRLGVGANALTVIGAGISTTAAITSYTRFAPQAFVAGTIGTDLVAISLVIKSGLAVKAQGPNVWQNVKKNVAAMFGSDPKPPTLTREQILDEVGSPPSVLATHSNNDSMSRASSLTSLNTAVRNF